MTLGFPGPLDAVKAASCDRRGGSVPSWRETASSPRSIRSSRRPGCGCWRRAATRSTRPSRPPWSARSSCPGAVASAAISSPWSPAPMSAGCSQPGERLAFHGSGIAPRGASLEFMREHGEDPPGGRRVMAQHGPLSPSVPGFVDGCFALLDRFGTRLVRRAGSAGHRLRRQWLPHLARRGARHRANSDVLRRFQRAPPSSSPTAPRHVPASLAPARSRPLALAHRARRS